MAFHILVDVHLLCRDSGIWLHPHTRNCTFPYFSLSLVLIKSLQYAPVLLRWRAEKLHKASGKQVYYISVHHQNQSKSLGQVLRTNLSRPFSMSQNLSFFYCMLILSIPSVFLVTEPIVLFLAIYISIVYGTLYALFAAFPIVFQQHRHFNTGEGGLAFLGVGLGIIMGTASQSIQNRIYWRSMDQSATGRATPEAFVVYFLVPPSVSC